MPNPTPHEPTEQTRKTVESMCAYGVPQEDIASVIGIDAKTLRKYYRQELDTATAKANSKVAQALYRKAVEKDDTSAQIFWLKTRGKWSEKIEVDNRYVDKKGDDLVSKDDLSILNSLGMGDIGTED